MEKIIEKINDLLCEYDVYAVGGFARDLFLKRKCKDIDLSVNKGAFECSKKIAFLFKTKLITLDKSTNTYRIMLKNSNIVNIDISAFKGKTIQEDLQNRDFTVNAIAFNLKYFENFNKYIIMLNKNVLKDLKAKKINTVSIKSFKSDPLRMIRGFRFVAEIGFKLSKKTLSQVKQNAKFINEVAPERIKTELFKILASEKSSVLVSKMDKCGLLSAIFPKIERMKMDEKKYYYHPNGLFQHSFETMVSAEKILNNFQKYFPDNYIDMQNHFGNNDFFSESVTRMGLLKFAALFHDNAKPETVTFKDGKIHFFNHEQFGAENAKNIMLSIKLSKKDIEYVMFLIRWHMRLSTLTKNNIVTKRAALKLFRDIGDRIPDLIVLSMADWYSYKSLKISSSKGLKFQEKYVKDLLKYYYELKNSKPLHKIINGTIIMEKFDLKSGPWIGELLKIAFSYHDKGKVSNIKEVLKILSSKLTQIKKKYKIR
ncbi:MAG: HD domain-containing protein [Endomicrobium sp.]|jgi:poly(A) polymerase|nr:HD domain-containing protein [Endomicrobium sp.]